MNPVILHLKIWKSGDIIGFPKYEISSYGEVRNVKTGKIIKPFLTEAGYYRYHLCDKDSNSKTISAHRLVAFIFIGKCPEKGYTVDHIDRNRINNQYLNLRWITSKVQAENRTQTPTRKGRAIYQYSLDGSLIKRWDSSAQAGNELKIHKTRISDACKGKISAGNFNWRFCDEIDLIPGEIWKQLPYEEYGNIQASNMGRIKFSEGWISMGTLSGSYLTVVLKNIITAEATHHGIHRLVMATFIC